MGHLSKRNSDSAPVVYLNRICKTNGCPRRGVSTHAELYHGCATLSSVLLCKLISVLFIREFVFFFLSLFWDQNKSPVSV